MVEIVQLAEEFLVLVIAAVVGFTVFYSVNTSGWNTTVVSLWTLLPVVFIGVAMIGLFYLLKRKGK